MINLFFVHIEKAAGTSFHDLLREQYFPYHILEPVRFDVNLNYTSKKVNPKVIRILNRWLGVKHFGGHCIDVNTAYSSIDDAVQVISLLREPLGRTLSHYFYQREVMGIDWTLDEFIGNDQFQNFMCRKICGEPSADKVIELLGLKQINIGAIEEMAQSLSSFRASSHNQWLSLPDKMSKRNVRANRISKTEEVSSEMRDRIKSLNNEDFKLYEYVLAHVSESSTENNSVKQSVFDKSKFCLISNKLYSVFILRPIERLLRKIYPDVVV